MNESFTPGLDLPNHKHEDVKPFEGRSEKPKCDYPSRKPCMKANREAVMNAVNKAK